MASDVGCDLCHRNLPIHESFVLKMEVYADPSMPPMTAEEIASADFDEALSQVLDQVQHLTAEQLQDGVHRCFEFRLCPACHRQFLSNPLGKPREKRVSPN
jgi:hypothetical protein